MVSHHIRGQVFIGPIRLTRALLPWCNIEGQGEEQREEIPIPTAIALHSDIFFPLLSLTCLLQIEKSNLYKALSDRGWGDSSIHHILYGAAVELVKASVMIMCIGAYVALTYMWFDLQRRRQELKLDSMMFWFDLERNRHDREMSPAPKEQGNQSLQLTSAFSCQHDIRWQVGDEKEEIRLPPLKQCTQRWVRAVTESSLSSS